MFARNSTGTNRQNNQSQSRRNNRKVFDIDGVTAMIKKDVDECRQSKCWPFSVYSPKLSGEIPDNYMDEGISLYNTFLYIQYFLKKTKIIFCKVRTNLTISVKKKENLLINFLKTK